MHEKKKILYAFLVMLYTVGAISCSTQSRKLHEDYRHFQSVGLGMTEEQVIAILGKPMQLEIKEASIKYASYGTAGPPDPLRAPWNNRIEIEYSNNIVVRKAFDGKKQIYVPDN